MGEGLEHPERLVGMHFFNPVALMPLVELIRTPETDDASLATAWAVADRLRKRPVLVNDAPGFVVNRLLTRMMVVVLESVERGNSVEEADEAVLMLGLPMAPSVLLQMVGEQVATHVRETLQAAYPGPVRDHRRRPGSKRRRDPGRRARSARGRGRATCSRKASSTRRRTSTPRSSSAPASRSSWAA